MGVQHTLKVKNAFQQPQCDVRCFFVEADDVPSKIYYKMQRITTGTTIMKQSPQNPSNGSILMNCADKYLNKHSRNQRTGEAVNFNKNFFRRCILQLFPQRTSALRKIRLKATNNELRLHFECHQVASTMECFKNECEYSTHAVFGRKRPNEDGSLSSSVVRLHQKRNTPITFAHLFKCQTPTSSQLKDSHRPLFQKYELRSKA